MTPRINYYRFDVEDFRALAVGLIEHALPYLPWWVEEVNVFPSTADHAAASITCYPEYRRVQIYIHTIILDETPEDRERILIHEVAHASVAPLVEWVRQNLIPYVERVDKQTGEIMAAELSRRYETVTEDLAGVFGRLR